VLQVVLQGMWAGITGVLNNLDWLLLNAPAGVALAVAWLPALQSALRRSALGTLLGIAIGSLAAAVYVSATGLAVLTWLAGWCIADAVSLRAQRRRADEERYWAAFRAAARRGALDC
jgi:hypothetical protein